MRARAPHGPGPSRRAGNSRDLNGDRDAPGPGVPDNRTGAYLLVVGGQIEVEKDGTTESGGPGYLVHFDPNERREVRAASDARLVLVLGPWPGEGHPSGRPASAA